MKIALIKKKPQKKQYHFKSYIIYNKEDLPNQNYGVSSKFRRYMARNIKAFHRLRQQTTKENDAKTTTI
jgi:hypothetical protein